MPYKYLHGITMEDIAFQATGETCEDLFISAADALMQIMVDNLNEIAPDIERIIEASDSSLDLLLCKFLNEFVYYKDAYGLLLRCHKVDIDQGQNEGYHLKAMARGVVIDRRKHHLKTDIKAVTLYHLKVTESKGCWQAMVVVDV